MGHARKKVGIRLCFDHLIQGKFECNRDKKKWSMKFFRYFHLVEQLAISWMPEKVEWKMLQNHKSIRDDKIRRWWCASFCFSPRLCFMHFISFRNSDYFSLELWMFDKPEIVFNRFSRLLNWLRLFTDHGIGARFQIFSWVVCFQQFYATFSALIDLRGRIISFFFNTQAIPKQSKQFFATCIPAESIFYESVWLYKPKISFIAQSSRKASKK